MRAPRIVITSGEPAGIGPDACIALAQRDWPADLIVVGDADLISEAAKTLQLPLRLMPYDSVTSPQAHSAGTLRVLHLPVRAPVVAGRLDARNASYVIAMLDRACDGCMSGEFAAMVTAPVQKSTIIEGGYVFSGHTEYLAERTGAKLPVMLLLHAGLRVALLTTHLALRDVPDAVTAQRLRETLAVVHYDMGRRFGIGRPRIGVLGLNPHAGESGHLGREEIEVIEPVLRDLRAAGMDVRGPLPADTAFTHRCLDDLDVVLAMYHDQGLPVLKHAAFGDAVNMTLGLPILRTSVDHGTALSIARTGTADTGSLAAALRLAIDLAGDRNASA